MKKLHYHTTVDPSVVTKPRSPYWTSLTDVAKWKPDDEFNVAKVNLKERPLFQNDDTPQNEIDKRECEVVVCHDMAGGYHEDFFDIGYSVQYWQYVDIFIYFSHHRLTVPPSQWTNAAHRNGVKVLGTFITEWQRDMLENELWVRGPHSSVPLYDNENVNREIVSTFFADKMVDNVKQDNPDEGSIISRIIKFPKNITVLMNNLFADKGLAVAHYITPRLSPGVKNFYTNFDRGCGYKFFIEGKEVLEQEWAHLSHQSIQPSSVKSVLKILSSEDDRLHYNHETSKDVNWELTFDQAYNGGTSVLVKGTDQGQTTFALIPLFDLNIAISSQNHTRARITYLPKDYDFMVGLYVRVGINRKGKDDASDDDKIVINFSDTNLASQDQNEFSIVSIEDDEVHPTKGIVSQKFQKFETSIVSTENDWITAEISIPPDTFSSSKTDLPVELFIQELGVLVVRQSFPIRHEEQSPTSEPKETEPPSPSVILYVGELSVSTSPHYIFNSEVQNVFWNNRTLRIEHMEFKGLLRISGTVEWELGIQVTDNSIRNSLSDVDKVNSFGYYYIYVATHSSQKRGPEVGELTFLGVSDVNMFVIAGYDVPVSKIEKDTVLSVWVQGVRETDGKCERPEKWKKCEIALSSYVVHGIL
ncbi:5301_t:CDS:2 [Acaulospora colombiana]|uniref:5301_t:CDS:1 n=1 Tax=Acaulospora colombiana TaxID=27376 RepID=A0ACA9KFD3_9GLOM|nr:5301_t:CDS:2 [Acaulospora colombiana]